MKHLLFWGVGLGTICGCAEAPEENPPLAVSTSPADPFPDLPSDDKIAELLIGIWEGDGVTEVYFPDKTAQIDLDGSSLALDATWRIEDGRFVGTYVSDNHTWTDRLLSINDEQYVALTDDGEEYVRTRVASTPQRIGGSQTEVPGIVEKPGQEETTDSAEEGR